MRRRSASETRTGSGGGGMAVASKVVKGDGDGRDGLGSNLAGGEGRSDVVGGWVAGLGVRASLLSEGYMTATWVDGEFMVPVRDHPIAVEMMSS